MNKETAMHEFKKAVVRDDSPVGHLFHALRQKDAPMDKIRELFAVVPADASRTRLVDCLNVAVANGNIEAVQLFVDAKMPLDAVRPGGDPPILHAAEGKFGEIVRLLASAGANMDAPGKKSGNTALMRAAFHSDPETVAHLLRCSAKPDLRNKAGDTALTVAVKQNNTGVVREMMAFGIDPDTPNKTGETPLMLAAKAGHEKLIDLLIDAGADPDKPSPDGDTAFMAAAQLGQTKSLRRLAARGADIHTKNAQGRGALYWAVKYRRVDVVDMLVDLGVKVDDPDNTGFTCLMRAVMNGDEQIVKKLLVAGASPTLGDNNGITALIYAVKTEKPVIPLLQTLIENGADIKAQDSAGKSALDHVIADGKKEVIEYLQTAGQRQRQARIERDARDATILDHEIAPLRGVPFKPKPPAP